MDKTKFLLTIVITAIVVGSGVYFWQELKVDSIKREKAAIEKTYCKGTWKNGVCIIKTCVDADVNEKPDDIYIKSKVTFTDDKGVSNTVYDECTGSNLQVQEMWCYESPAGTGNYVQGNMVYTCPKGCLDGACIR